MGLDHQSVTALVLAGARTGRDPVARMAGVANKVLAQVGGEPMISRVLENLAQSDAVGKRILCGPSWETVQDNSFLGTLIASGAVQWVEPATRSESQRCEVSKRTSSGIPCPGDDGGPCPVNTRDGQLFSA